jgi:hypothetical protein
MHRQAFGRSAGAESPRAKDFGAGEKGEARMKIGVIGAENSHTAAIA